MPLELLAAEEIIVVLVAISSQPVDSGLFAEGRTHIVNPITPESVLLFPAAAALESQPGRRRSRDQTDVSSSSRPIDADPKTERRLSVDPESLVKLSACYRQCPLNDAASLMLDESQ